MHDEGMAVTTEYVLLLGLSLMVFAAIAIGFDSFSNTASADARAESAINIATYVSGHISDATASGMAATVRIDLPEHIGGRTYILYPSADGRSICAMVNGADKEYQSPIISKAGELTIEGFMVSVPREHRLSYDPASKTVIIC